MELLWRQKQWRHSGTRRRFKASLQSGRLVEHLNFSLLEACAHTILKKGGGFGWVAGAGGIRRPAWSALWLKTKVPQRRRKEWQVGRHQPPFWLSASVGLSPNQKCVLVGFYSTGMGCYSGFVQTKEASNGGELLTICVVEVMINACLHRRNCIKVAGVLAASTLRRCGENGNTE